MTPRLLESRIKNHFKQELLPEQAGGVQERQREQEPHWQPQKFDGERQSILTSVPIDY